MTIKSIRCELFVYEVGIDDVARIELTDHGSDKTIIYKVVKETKEETYAGMTIPHTVEYE
ncbi:hypothetical protein [Macrococcoides caseolyticum]|uniref:Uncharacterized protein n=1 Tax=Macrococcoides caseolyticum TaxID=69966 RepID=A0A855H0V0_9STAP|nr:hypothetical protein [Macrococcus caseolyticus]PKE27133.1 hypothetical protein CW686_01425 [Macrococcus caseolyticus]PKE59644.1 hypothetical protein CW673_01515 [Macrococcus caseolyticus]PKE71123.1 hypothetical protein CW662_01090 [Macrococcus caseolyticus]